MYFANKMRHIFFGTYKQNKRNKGNSIKKRRPQGDPIAVYNQLSRGCRKFFSEVHSERRRGKGQNLTQEIPIWYK